MANKDLEKIMGEYTLGKAGLEATNAALKSMNSSVYLNPDQDIITEGEKVLTVVGYYPSQTSGWGLLDMSGHMEKARVEHGVLEYPIGEEHALFYVCGRCYGVDNDRLVELPEA